MIRRALVLLLAAGLSGCGYSATRLLPPNYRTIYIEPFENKIPLTRDDSERGGFQSNLPLLEEQVTRGVIDRFFFDGNLRVTRAPEDADLVLSGAMRDFFRQQVRRTSNDVTTEEYRLNLVAGFTVRDRDGKIIVDEPNLVGDTTYFLTGASATSESTAAQNLVADFSRRVVERVVENW
jgi:outer membrane lipopolysaccharide assembly protein LptE/RlpB